MSIPGSHNGLATTIYFAKEKKILTFVLISKAALLHLWRKLICKYNAMKLKDYHSLVAFSTTSCKTGL